MKTLLLRVLLAGALAVGPAAASAAPPAPAFTVNSGGIDTPLAAEGDPVRGRAIVASRQQGLCLLCHGAPIPEERFQGNLALDLSGVGARLTPAQLRLRIVDSRVLDPASAMPSFHRTEGLSRVGRSWQGKPILDAQQVEDVVAWLSTLR